MSFTAHESDDQDAGRVPPRTIRFADLPRQSLDQGRGSAREVWADLNTDLTLRWQLRVVEIKDSTGLLVGPAGTHHFVVGLAGPQVVARSAESRRVLRRDHVMPVLSSTVYFERSKLRPPGASSLIVLTFAAADPPEFVISMSPPDTVLAAGTQVLLALRGAVQVDGAEAGPGEALLLDPNRSHRTQAASAQLLTLHRPGSQPES